jgi:hypothetical protein
MSWDNWDKDRTNGTFVPTTRRGRLGQDRTYTFRYVSVVPTTMCNFSQEVNFMNNQTGNTHAEVCGDFFMRRDSDDCIKEIILNYDGFFESFAIPTTDLINSWWELNLKRKDGIDFYFVLPYTKSKDILETLFLQCIIRAKGK